MGAKSRYSLQRTMIIYFLLIGFASVLVGIEFLADFHGGALKDEIWETINRAGDQPIDQKEIFAPIDRMRSKAILMVGIIMVVMLIVLTMFIKHITEPLQHMIGLSEKISAGDLSQTIRIDADNELAQLGHVINEMASNLQEIILLSQGLCDNGDHHIDNALQQLDLKSLDAYQLDGVRQSIHRMKLELDTLREFVACFKFYSVDRHDVG
ncbi:MAG: HAMP domain-containing protein [Desulfobacteraceae bacterium]